MLPLSYVAWTNDSQVGPARHMVFHVTTWLSIGCHIGQPEPAAVVVQSPRATTAARRTSPLAVEPLREDAAARPFDAACCWATPATALTPSVTGAAETSHRRLHPRREALAVAGAGRHR